MDVILSADKKFAAVQLFQFVPYTYQPITSVQYFTNEKASAIAVSYTHLDVYKRQVQERFLYSMQKELLVTSNMVVLDSISL